MIIDEFKSFLPGFLSSIVVAGLAAALFGLPIILVTGIGALCYSFASLAKHLSEHEQLMRRIDRPFKALGRLTHKIPEKQRMILAENLQNQLMQGQTLEKRLKNLNQFISLLESAECHQSVTIRQGLATKIANQGQSMPEEFTWIFERVDKVVRDRLIDNAFRKLQP